MQGYNICHLCILNNKNVQASVDICIQHSFRLRLGSGFLELMHKRILLFPFLHLSVLQQHLAKPRQCLVSSAASCNTN